MYKEILIINTIEILPTTFGLFLIIFLLLWSIARNQELNPQVYSAFFIQLTVGIFLLLFYGLRADAYTYHFAAIAQSQIWQGLQPTTENLAYLSLATNPGKELFTWILGLLYLMLGPSPLIAIILNSFFMSLVVICLTDATQGFGFSNSRNIAGWLSALIPPFLYWSPYVSREALSFLLLSLTVLAASMVFRKNLFWGLLFYFLSFQALVYARAQLTLVVLASIFMVFISAPYSFFRNKNAFRIHQPWVLLFGILTMTTLGILQLTGYFNSTVRALPVQIKANSNPAYGLAVIDKKSENATSLNSSQPNQNTSTDVSINDIFLSVWSQVKDFSLAMWGPPPWDWSNWKFIVAGLDGLGYLVIWVLVLMTFLVFKQYRWQILCLIVPLLPLIFGVTASLANYGIVMRVRAHYLPFLIPIVALFIYNRRKVWLFLSKVMKQINTLFIKSD